MGSPAPVEGGGGAGGRGRGVGGRRLRLRALVQGGGFEPPKAEPAGLQPAPFGHSGTPAGARHCSLGAHGVVGAVRRMTRRSGYLFVALLAAVLVPGVGAVRSASERLEPPLAVIVATSPSATSGVLADGSWSVELPFLHAGDVDPAVSPDGLRIAFVSERAGNEEVYVADARSGEVRRLTRNRRPDRRPGWAPGGRQIVWQSGAPGAADLHIIGADGRGRGGPARGRGGGTGAAGGAAAAPPP